MAAINTELLRRALAYVEAYRDEWFQGCWRACIAGHAAILAGGRWAIEDPDHALHFVLVPEDDDLTKDVGIYDAADGWDGEPLRAVTVSVRARRVLGLTNEQALRLFDSRNDLHRLHVIVSDLCEEAA